MYWAGLVVMVVAVMAVLLGLKGWRPGAATDTVTDEAWPFYPKKPLTQPEQVLYFCLV